jgi:hypothetical protein
VFRRETRPEILLRAQKGDITLCDDLPFFDRIEGMEGSV